MEEVETDNEHIKTRFYDPLPADYRISDADLARHAEAAWARSELYANAAVMWETLIPMAHEAAAAGQPDLRLTIMASKCIEGIEKAMHAADYDEDVYDYGRMVIETFQRIKIEHRATEVDDDDE